LESPIRKRSLDLPEKHLYLHQKSQLEPSKIASFGDPWRISLLYFSGIDPPEDRVSFSSSRHLSLSHSTSPSLQVYPSRSPSLILLSLFVSVEIKKKNKNEKEERKEELEKGEEENKKRRKR
jgi:hypothetical protein